MVFAGRPEEEEEKKLKTRMAMGPERSKALHNFTLPCLKWGNQRYLRCQKEAPGEMTAEEVDRRSQVDRVESSSPVTRRRELERRRKRDWKSGIDGGGVEGIDAVREKLLFDLKTATDKMKDAIFRKEVAVTVAVDEEEEEEEEEDEEEEEEEVEIGEELAPPSSAMDARPWNLRTRRAACKAPIGPKGLRIEERKVNYSPLRSDNNGVYSPRLRLPEKEKEKPRTKLTVPLSRKEIEEDFMVMLGQRPARRPKKRSRNVQKQMDVSNQYQRN